MTAPKLTAVATVHRVDDRFAVYGRGVAINLTSSPAIREVYGPLLRRECAVRITIEPSDAPAPTPPRPAEEIAREMVPDETERFDGDWGFYVRIRDADQDGGFNVVAHGYVLQWAAARDVRRVRAGLVALIEQSRAEGAAAERERYAPLLRAARRWHATMSDDGGPAEEQIAADVELTEAVEALGTPPPDATEQPRDLAGSIRALAQKYAGLVSEKDADRHTVIAACDVLRFLHLAARVAHGDDGGPSLQDILHDMRVPARRNPRSYVLSVASQAADDLEVIIRECSAPKENTK